MRSTPSSPAGGATARGDFQRGLLAGFTPVALLLAVVALVLLAVIGAQMASASLGFDTQQPITVTVLVVGLAVGGITYTVACVRALRRVGAWQLTGADARASGALWALGVGALVVLLPLIVAALWPQHPAPLLPPGQ